MLHLPAAGFGLWLDSVSVHADLWASLSTIKASKELKAFFYTCNQITGYFERFLHVSLSLVCVHAWKASWHNCCQLWRDSNASGKGCVSQFQLNIFLKSRFANVCQRAPPPLACKQHKDLQKHRLLSNAKPLTLNSPLSSTRTLLFTFSNQSGALAFSLKWTASWWKRFCCKQDNLANVKEGVLFHWRLWGIRFGFCLFLNK